MAEIRTADYAERTYGAVPVGFGEKPGIVVVDFQTAFTDAQYAMGGSPMIMRAVENTARLLEAARRAGVPVANCYTAYSGERDMPYWKVGIVHRELLHGHPSTQFEPRTYDRDYDIPICKSGPSIFFQTPVVPFFIKERVDTVIVTGCVTSGCVRASVIDSFQYGFRTIVPEDCVGDHDEQPHQDNLRDIERRYGDVCDADTVIEYIEGWRGKNER